MWSYAIMFCLSLFTVLTVAACAWSPPGYKGPESDHFDGKEFFNPSDTEEQGFGEFLKWATHRKPGPWKTWTDAAPGPRPPDAVGEGALRVTFVNHSTMLIQMDGINILTDPVWSDRASPVSFTGPKRARPPGIRFEDLPRIDAVIISHNHYDHMDIPTLKRLNEKHRPRFYVPLGNSPTLRRARIEKVYELDWWEKAPLSERASLLCVPARHFSVRGTTDSRKTLWAGYVIEGDAGNVYFAGDTGFSPHLAEIKERVGTVRLALLPIGAFIPAWFMAPHHMSPDDALLAHAILGAGTSAAIHFGTFPLADDGQEEPADRLRQALAKADMGATRFWILEPGEGRDVPAL